MKIVILVAFGLIFLSLGSALFYLVRDRGGTRNVVRALSFRVAFSVALFAFILLSHWMGWIQSSGIPMR